jgi:hypothetical protein
MAAKQEEALPVPCRTCGAPMEEASAALHGEVEMKCTHCGATETLPAEPSERVRVVRRRLQQLAWTRQNVEGSAIAVSRAIESWKWAALGSAILYGVTICHQVVTAFEHSDSAITAHLLLGPFMQLAILICTFTGGIMGMRAYAAAVRPGLLAFVPREAGAAPRCRCCGGDLPRGGGAGVFVQCTFCQTPNLLSSALAERKQEDLDRELRARRDQAAGVGVALAAAQKTVTRATAIGAIAGMAISLASYSLLVEWLAAP